jgi:hypothetical protein
MNPKNQYLITKMALPAGTVRNMYSRGFAKFAHLKTVIQSQGYFAIGKLRLIKSGSLRGFEPIEPYRFSSHQPNLRFYPPIVRLALGALAAELVTEGGTKWLRRK